MKKGLLLLTTAILGASFQAQAVTSKEYVAVRGGYAAMKHQSRENYRDISSPIRNDWNGDAGIGSVAYGLKAGYLRVEVEGNASSTTKETKRFYSDDYLTNFTTTARINTSSALFNSYLELPVKFPLKPYISAGAGMAHIKAKYKTRASADNQVSNVNFSGNHFAWQIGAGLAYEITPEWAMDLGYRFMDYGSITKKIIDYSGGQAYLGKMRLNARIYSAYFGIRYAF